MQVEQLSLPRFRIPSRGPVAVVLMLRDVETDDPKVLMAERPNGRKTFPGGKLKRLAGEYRRPAKGGRRELYEETGIVTYDEEDLIEFAESPLRVAVDGREKAIHVFFSFSDESTANDKPIHREPKKNTPWEYISIRSLPWLVGAGKLHPIVTKIDIDGVVAEAREVSAAPKANDELPRFTRSGVGYLDYIHERDLHRQMTAVVS